jgi:hypothetical protein
MGNNGTIIILRWVCQYNMQTNLNGLKQLVICDVNVFVCKICNIC